MKNMLLLMLIAVSLCAYAPQSAIRVSENDKVNVEYILLIESIAHTESRFDISAVMEETNALGLMQIRDCVIKDVNRKYNKNYSHEDVFNPFIAITIFELYCDMYNAKSNEERIRLWYGGPNKLRYSETTNIYYNKVRGYYDSKLTSHYEKFNASIFKRSV